MIHVMQIVSNEGMRIDTYIDHADVSLIEDSSQFNDQSLITLKNGKTLIVDASASAVMMLVNQARNDMHQWPA